MNPLSERPAQETGSQVGCKEPLAEEKVEKSKVGTHRLTSHSRRLISIDNAHIEPLEQLLHEIVWSVPIRCPVPTPFKYQGTVSRVKSAAYLDKNLIKLHQRNMFSQALPLAMIKHQIDRTIHPRQVLGATL